MLKQIAISSDGERALSLSFLLDSFRKIMGRTLTVIDGAIVDERQNKALKDQIRNIFSDEIEFSSEWAYNQKILNKMIEEIPEDQIGEPVSIEEALGV